MPEQTFEPSSADHDTVPPHAAPAGRSATATAPAAKPAERPQTLPPWHVVLLDDDEHTYDYVIEMLINLCGHSLQAALRLARSIDRDGRGVIFTAHRELAELKREQIREFGHDPRVAACRGSMLALLEPAEQ